VDIGSNDGTLLRAFQNRGMRVLGIDPAREQARRATESGVETVNAFFNAALAAELRKDRGPASIITANNVFANIDDLHGFMEGVRALLAPDGAFVFETGYFPDLVTGHIIDNIYHEHLSYYSVKPLQRFFKRHGMNLVRVDHEPTKGGSIRCFVVQHDLSAPPSVPMQQLIKNETEGGFDRPERQIDFGKKIEGLRDMLVRRIADLKAQNRTVAGYGASVGVTTLLYYFDLGQSLSFLADDNPVRHGRFSPGNHIPVLPSQSLYDRRPDDVLLLAWRYEEPIRKRHME